MGMIDGFLETEEYIKRIAKFRAYGRVYDDVDFSTLSEDQIRKLHSIAVEDEMNTTKTVFKIRDVLEDDGMFEEMYGLDKEIEE